MKTLRFYGHSDDTFGEYGVTKQDIVNFGKNEPIQCIIIAGDERLIVTGHCHIHPFDYSWTIGVAQFDQYSKVPNWSIRMMDCQVPHSICLEIDVPDDFRLKWYSGNEPITKY